jgi:photosystem II stability/assembly factor-like uncharacterized protein
MTRPAALFLAAAVVGTLVAGTSGARAQTAMPLDSTTIASFRWRAIGPANMAGRITDVEAIPSPSKTAYFAAATGGIWKTTNGGTTFRPVFDGERVISMGDLAIAPSDTNQIWAGTGEEDSRNSISPGGGIYKSTDGARTWRRMGLEKTEHIGRVVVHPTNPNVVWVAALGAAWRPNAERGLYKTTDGGQTWRLVKFISDRAGFVDVAIHPTNPDVLWAASWERQRGPYFLKSGGPGSALWKSTDGGETWTKVEGGGLPTTTLGRIGIDVSRSNPDYIYLMVEADTAPNSVAGRPAQQRPSGLYRSTDGGRTWERRAPQNVRPFYYSQVRVDPKNPERVYWSSTPVMFSDDGGKTARQATLGLHVDHHAMWIDPNDPEHFIVGNDGGIGITWDKGGNYDFVNTMPLGQFYNVSYDMSVPYRVCGGLQDNGSWCGPSRRKQGPITNGMWASVSGGDGFHTASDPTDPDIIYSESQGGNMGRLNWATGERVLLVRPDWRTRYRQFEDSILIERPDTTQPATREQQRRVAELRTRQRTDSTESFMRWNWNTPFFLSPHNPRVFYAAGNRVVKSTNRGEDLRVISPDLSKRLLAKIDTSIRKTGGVTPDLTGAETYGTVVSLAESPLRPGILWAGTDDGNVWVTRNDGATWDNLTGRFPGLPDNEVYVSRIEPSRFDTATVYVSFDNHRRGDFTPYLFTSTDFGRTFLSIANNLPRGGPDFVHVVREDPINRDLLFAGTDVGAYVSLDRGQSWQRFMAGFPTVPVHDLQIHPRDHELIAGTHGRSIWIVDIAPLEQMTRDVASRPVHLFQPKTALQYNQPPAEGGSSGHRVFAAPSPAYGAEIAYRLASSQTGQARLVITDARGDTLRTLTGPARAGLHRVTWDFRGRTPPAPPLSPSGRRDSIQLARRTDAVIDSLVQTGMNRQALERLRARIASGEIGGFFGGGGQAQQRGVFTERPGEGAFPRQQIAAEGGRVPRQPATPREVATPRDTALAAAPRGQEGGRGEAGGDVEMLDPSFAQDFIRLTRPPGQGGGGGGFGGQRLAPLVATGDYLVTLEVGGQRQRQVLRVERIGGSQSGRIVASPTPERDD